MTNENCEISGVIFFHCLIFLWVRYSQYPVCENKIRPSRKVGDQGLHPYMKETKVLAVYILIFRVIDKLEGGKIKYFELN
jgi:hypothetical protein